MSEDVSLRPVPLAGPVVLEYPVVGPTPRTLVVMLGFLARLGFPSQPLAGG